MFKTTKSKVIFVVIFSIICVVITALLVLYKNIDIEDKNVEIKEELAENKKEKDVSGIDLNGTYNQNDIKVEEKSATKEKVEIRYSQISGLKNKEIQDSINRELEEVALNCYREKIENLNEVINVSVNTWNSANFANTISFNINYYSKIDDDSEDFYQDSKGLNYDLNTGEKITLDKLFTSDAPIEDILRKSAYYSLIQNRVEDNLIGELVVRDYGELEEEIAEIINLYKKGKLTEFYYTPRYIYIFYKNNNICIDMKDYAEYIAIYSRYLTDENIYETNNIGYKNLYTLTSRYNDTYYYTNYQKEGNYFIDISIINHSETEFSKNLADEKIKDIEAEIANVKQLVERNPNNFYILNYYIYIYTSEEWSTKQILISYNERGNSYEVTVHDFEENIEPRIIEYNRQEFYGGLLDYIYDFSEILKIEPQEVIEYYNPETGEKVVV